MTCTQHLFESKCAHHNQALQKVKNLMTNMIHQPHDKLFKNLLTHKKAAQDFFQHFLPQKVKEKIDLNYLEVTDKDFIDKALKHSSADLLFNTRFGDQKAYLYLLVEHQTTVNKYMPLKLWKYIINILEQHQKMHQDEDYLPLVYPLVFYAPKDKTLWEEPIDLIQLFEPGSQDLAKSFLYEPFQLIDVNKVDEKNVIDSDELASLILTMKYRHDLSAVLPLLQKCLQSLALSEEMDYINTICIYILRQGESDSPKQVVESLKAGLGDKVVGNIAEYLVEQGKLEGKLEGIYQTAGNMLKEGADHAFVARTTGLSLSEIKKLADELSRDTLH